MLDKLINCICETTVKESIKFFISGAVIGSIFMWLNKNLVTVISFLLLIIAICISIIKIKNYIKERKVLKDYLNLIVSANWNYLFAEKFLLRLLVNKHLSSFLNTADLKNILTDEFLDIEEHSDLEPEESTMIHHTWNNFSNTEYLNTVIDHLISYKFVYKDLESNKLYINNLIFNYINKQNLKLKKENESAQKKRHKKLERRRIRQQKPSKIKILKLFLHKIFFKKLKFSNLEHTWILDIDGTLVKHNGYKIDGHDTLLDGVKDFFQSIPYGDKVILLTARGESYLEDLKNFLKENNLDYDYLLTDIPMGERILVNDRKPSGLDMAFAINKNRNEKLDINYKINEEL